jgi:hypothetical protein
METIWKPQPALSGRRPALCGAGTLAVAEETGIRGNARSGCGVMVRKGSTVRVRARALRKPRSGGPFLYLEPEGARQADTKQTLSDASGRRFILIGGLAPVARGADEITRDLPVPAADQLRAPPGGAD